MSTSTIILYRQCKIIPQKNFKVDNIASYLSTLTKETITNFQYIKHGLNIQIKLDLSQTLLSYRTPLNYNYVSILNSNEALAVYYFVTKKEWRGENTLLLNLEMDTINSFIIGTHYSFTDKTLVNREHKDRFYAYDGNQGGYLESVTSVNLFDGREWVLKKSFASSSDVEDGRVFASNNDGVLNVRQLNGRIDTTYTNIKYIQFLNGFMYVVNASNNTILYINMTTSAFSNRHYGFIINSGEYEGNTIDNFGFKFKKRYTRKINLTTEGINPLLYGSDESILSGGNIDWYLIYKGTSPLRCYLTTDNGFVATLNGNNTIGYASLSAGYYQYLLPEENGGYIKLIGDSSVNLFANIYDSNVGQGATISHKFVLAFYRSGNEIKVVRLEYADIGLGYFYVGSSQTYTFTSIELIAASSITYYGLAYYTTNTATMKAGVSGTYAISPTTYNIYGIDNLDRTESDLYKIIKLPYKPVSSFDGWKYDSTLKMIYLDYPNIPFKNTITSATFNPLHDLSCGLDLLDTTPAQEYESKMYHSDFYQNKFIYDSFSFVFALELVDVSSYSYFYNFDIDFVVTSTMNSNFMFVFTNYNTGDYKVSDYDDILIVSRNNEIAIYNDAYLNYIKNGYNYDVKSKDRQNFSNWLGFGLSMTGAVTSFALGGPVGAVAGISLATSTLAQLTNAINTTAQSEQNMQQRLQQLRMQRISVAGSDDIDLMTAYTGNKAKFMVYKPSERMQNSLYSLFFYTGYSDGTTHVPDYTSRSRFNFVSCDPVFNVLANLSEEILEDLETRYKTGVTFLHQYKGIWDFSQQYENWETSLL